MTFLRAAYIAIRFGDRRLWRAKGFFLLLWKSLFAGRADAETVARRNAFCRACPIFNQRYGTCGSPLSDHPELGCYCLMIDFKNKLKSAGCWLRENTNFRYGWPADL